MKVADIKRAACVGGGVIGSSWAIQFAMRGLAVTLYDINDEQLKRSEAQMHKSLDALEQFNAITPERRGEIVAAIRLTTSMEEAVADAQFIQESGPERLEIKQSILAQVEACAAADASLPKRKRPCAPHGKARRPASAATTVFPAIFSCCFRPSNL